MRGTPILLPLLLASLLASCGERVSEQPSANRTESSAPAAQATTAPAMPVRIGELGPGFEACAATGTTRQLRSGERLPVRAGPFQDAAETGGVPAGASFFICSRSLDQKWLGIVFQANGSLDESCGVSEPVPARRAYDGPCGFGWVASASVRTTAGAKQPAAANQSPPAGKGA